MFTCLLAGGIATGVAIGLIVVFAIQPHNYHSERQASAGLDLALGLILLLIGGLVMTGILARIWARRAQSRRRPENKHRAGMDWAQRALSEPRLGVSRKDSCRSGPTVSPWRSDWSRTTRPPMSCEDDP